MAYELQILKSARLEYLSIIEYLLEEFKSPSAAAHFIDEYTSKTKTICIFPLSRPLSHCQELADREFRYYLVMNYIVLYRFVDDVVEIAHIFHQSQDYASAVLESSEAAGAESSSARTENDSAQTDDETMATNEHSAK